MESSISFPFAGGYTPFLPENNAPPPILEEESSPPYVVAGLPLSFYDNVKIGTVLCYRYKIGDLPANLLYPDIAKGTALLQQYRDALGSRFETANKFICRQAEFILKYQEISLSDLTQKLFHFFATSLKFDLEINQTKSKGLLKDGEMRSIDLDYINFLPFYYLWSVSDSEERRESLNKALLAILRLLRPLAKPTHSIITYIGFKEWIEPILSQAIAESNALADKFLPVSKMTGFKRSEFLLLDRFVENDPRIELLTCLNSELDQIIDGDDQRREEIIKHLSYSHPYCDEVSVSEGGVFVFYNEIYSNRRIYKVRFQPTEIHRADFYLSYISPRNFKHGWGHSNRVTIASDQSLKRLRSVVREQYTSCENVVERCKEEEEKRDELEDLFRKTIGIIDKGSNVYISINFKKYRLCEGNCQKLETSFIPSNEALEITPENLKWDKLTEIQREAVSRLFSLISQRLRSTEFYKKFHSFISFIFDPIHKKSNAEKTIEFDLRNESVHEAFFPIFLEVWNQCNEGDLIPFCFLVDRIMKIFDLYCSDGEYYAATQVLDPEHKLLAKLIVRFAAVRKNPKSGDSLSMRCYSKFIYKLKLKEVDHYFSNLIEGNSEIKLNNKKCAFAISKLSDSSYQIAWRDLICHEFGFSYIRQISQGFAIESTSFMEISDLTERIIRASSFSSEISNFIKKYNLENSSDLSAIFEFIARCWDQKVYIIPLFENLKDQSNKQQRAGGRGRASKGRERGVASSKARRSRLALKKEQLREHIKRLTHSKDLELSEEKRSDSLARREKKISSDSVSSLSLPSYLLKLKLANFDDYFCDLAKEMMTDAYNEQLIEQFNRHVDSPHFQLVPLPSETAAIEDNVAPKTILLDSLHDYQVDAVNRFERWKEVNCGGIIAFEPGMGKTRVGCEIILRSLISSSERPCLVLAPSLVKSQWVDEFLSTLHKAAYTVAAKIKRHSNDKDLINQAEKLLELRRGFNPPTSINFCKSNEKVDDLDKERLGQFLIFYQKFKKEDIKLIDSPEDFRALIDASKEKSDGAKGLIIAQYSYFENNFSDPDCFASLAPSVVIADEGHEMLSLTEKPGKLGKTTKFDSIFREWECPKVALTATPLVNDLFDIIDLLMLLTNGERSFHVAEHFEKLLIACSNKILDYKAEWEELEEAETLEELPLLVEKYAAEIFPLSEKALSAFLWLKEKLINPRIARAERNREAAQGESELEKREIALKIEPTKAQSILHDRVSENHGNAFFTFTNLVSSLLIHPDLITIKDKYKKNYRLISGEDVIEKTAKFSCNMIDDYIRQSGLLSAIFLKRSAEGEIKTIADAMAENSRALIFVAQKVQAQFIKAIAKIKFELTDNEVFEVHSGNRKSSEQIARFKSLKGKGIMILLPKSGGSGLNFTTVPLNILAAVGWTHKEQEQCAGRILRGKGVKNITTIAYPFKSAKHIENIVRKKELLSELFLDVTSVAPEEMVHWWNSLLSTSEAFILAKLEHCEAGVEWKKAFAELQTKIGTKFGDGEKVWHSYNKLKEKAEGKISALDQLLEKNSHLQQQSSRKRPYSSEVDLQQEPAKKTCLATATGSAVFDWDGGTAPQQHNMWMSSPVTGANIPFHSMQQPFQPLGGSLYYGNRSTPMAIGNSYQTVASFPSMPSQQQSMWVSPPITGTNYSPFHPMQQPSQPLGGSFSYSHQSTLMPIGNSYQNVPTPHSTSSYPWLSLAAGSCTTTLPSSSQLSSAIDLSWINGPNSVQPSQDRPDAATTVQLQPPLSQAASVQLLDLTGTSLGAGEETSSSQAMLPATATSNHNSNGLSGFSHFNSNSSAIDSSWINGPNSVQPSQDRPDAATTVQFQSPLSQATLPAVEEKDPPKDFEEKSTIEVGANDREPLPEINIDDDYLPFVDFDAPLLEEDPFGFSDPFNFFS